MIDLAVYAQHCSTVDDERVQESAATNSSLHVAMFSKLVCQWRCVERLLSLR
jgi:hypothetical protein